MEATFVSEITEEKKKKNHKLPSEGEEMRGFTLGNCTYLDGLPIVPQTLDHCIQFVDHSNNSSTLATTTPKEV